MAVQKNFRKKNETGIESFSSGSAGKWSRYFGYPGEGVPYSVLGGAGEQHLHNLLQPPNFRAKRAKLDGFGGLQPESQGQNLAVTVLHVPYSQKHTGTCGTRPPPCRQKSIASGHPLQLVANRLRALRARNLPNVCVGSGCRVLDS